MDKKHLLTTTDIQDLLALPKPVAKDWRLALGPRPVPLQTMLRGSTMIRADNGLVFMMWSRVSPRDSMNFSVGLALVQAERERNLFRCNGHHLGRHLNKVERVHLPARTCHVHHLTERYQARGFAEDGFAVVAPAYGDLPSAIEFAAALAGLTPDDGRMWV